MARKPTFAFATLVTVAGLALSGCITGSVDVGSDDQKLSAPPTPTDSEGCAAFCAIAEPKGCPVTGDCMELCLAERALSPSCTHRFDELLACEAPLLVQGCATPNQRVDTGGPPCSSHASKYLFCEANDPESTSYPWWYATDPLPPYRAPRFRDGRWSWPQQNMTFGRSNSSCDPITSECTCSLDGIEIGRCQTLLVLSHQIPAETCCGELLSHLPLFPED